MRCKEPKWEVSPGNAGGTTYIPSGIGTPCNPTGGETRCGWRRVRVGYFAGRKTRINSRKWMDRFSFLHFGLSSISNPKLKGLKMFSLQIFDPVWVERTWPFVVSSWSKINIWYRFYVWDSIVLQQYDEGFSSSLFYFFLALTLTVEVFSASSYP